MKKSRNKKIIFSLLDTPALGGAEKYLFTVLQHLSYHSYSVFLATNNSFVKKELLKKIGRNSAFHVMDLPYRLDAIGNWKGLTKYFFSLPSAIGWLCFTLLKLKKEGEVLCVFPGFTDRLSFSPLIKLFNCKLVWIEYGPLESTFKRNLGFPKLLFSLARPFVDKVITISRHSRHSLIRTGKISRRKIEIVYPGTKVFTEGERMRLQEQGRKILSEKMDLAGKESKFPVIGTIGRLAHEKEMDLLIRAWGRWLALKKENKKAILCLIGEGPARRELEELVKKLKIENNVWFTGFLSDEEKNALVSSFRLFIFPSSWELEGFGMTTIEAMALGVPVITTGQGPQAEIVEDKRNGWHFKAKNAEDLTLIIERGLNGKESVKFKLRSLKKIRESFSTENMNSGFLSIIDLLTKK